jgi:hypothetical protein
MEKNVVSSDVQTGMSEAEILEQIREISDLHDRRVNSRVAKNSERVLAFYEVIREAQDKMKNATSLEGIIAVIDEIDAEQIDLKNEIQRPSLGANVEAFLNRMRMVKKEIARIVDSLERGALTDAEQVAQQDISPVYEMKSSVLRLLAQIRLNSRDMFLYDSVDQLRSSFLETAYAVGDELLSTDVMEQKKLLARVELFFEGESVVIPEFLNLVEDDELLSLFCGLDMAVLHWALQHVDADQREQLQSQMSDFTRNRYERIMKEYGLKSRLRSGLMQKLGRILRNYSFPNKNSRGLR